MRRTVNLRHLNNWGEMTPIPLKWRMEFLEHNLHGERLQPWLRKAAFLHSRPTSLETYEVKSASAHLNVIPVLSADSFLYSRRKGETVGDSLEASVRGEISVLAGVSGKIGIDK